jgi:hypothetical protein
LMTSYFLSHPEREIRQTNVSRDRAIPPDDTGL